MDVMSLLGLVLGLSLYTWGIIEGGSVGAFVNAHGIVLVLGGTLAASMINCPARGLLDAVKAAMRIFLPSSPLEADRALDLVTAMARRARQTGVDSVEGDLQSFGDDGFALRAYRTCLSNPAETEARNVIERELLQTAARHRENINIFKTLGLVSPMMGLLGTVIGIVAVLRNISDPKMVGTSMGIAMSTAFYGIMLSGLLFTPISGKLRLRSQTEMLTKELVMEGILAVVFSDLPPSAIERKLIAFLAGESRAARSKHA